MIDTPDMFWFIVGALVVANFFMLPFGLTGMKLFSKTVEMPGSELIPLILIFVSQTPLWRMADVRFGRGKPSA